MVVQLSDQSVATWRVRMRPLASVIRGLGISSSLVLFASFLSAQTSTGRILGTVTDRTGAAVSGATVTIVDIQRGTTRVLTTDDAGAYVAPSLSPSSYKVRAEAKGFKTVEHVDVPVEVAQDVRIDLSLQPGEVSETVEVSGEVPLLNTTSS